MKTSIESHFVHSSSSRAKPIKIPAMENKIYNTYNHSDSKITTNKGYYLTVSTVRKIYICF